MLLELEPTPSSPRPGKNLLHYLYIPYIRIGMKIIAISLLSLLQDEKKEEEKENYLQTSFKFRFSVL